MNLFSVIELLPGVPYPDKAPVHMWQWNRARPDWYQFVSNDELARKIVRETVASSRIAIAESQKDFADQNARARDPRPTDPDQQWAERCAAALGQILAYLSQANHFTADDVDVACSIARDRLKLDDFAALTRQVVSLQAQAIVSRQSDTNLHFLAPPTFGRATTAVKLLGPNKPAIVGNKQKTLNSAQYALIDALVAAGPTGMTLSSLKKIRTDAAGILTRLCARDTDWRAVIHMAKIPYGRYRID